MKLISFNVNGIRAIEKKGFFEWMHKESPDILCLQETKAHPSQLEEKILNQEGVAITPFEIYSREGQKALPSLLEIFASRRIPIEVHQAEQIVKKKESLFITNKTVNFPPQTTQFQLK